MEPTLEKNRDWIGTWFVLAKERGFQTEIVFGAQKSPKEIHWQKFSHAEFDGVGLALNYFRNQGLNPTMPLLPEKYRKAHVLARLMGLIRALRFIPVKGAKWNRLAKITDETKFADKNYGDYVYRVLSTEDTDKVLKNAKARGVTATSHLLFTLDQVIKPEIASDGRPHYWMVPVNMRGAVQRPSDTCNQQSWVWVDTLPVQSPIDIQTQMHLRFKENFHWGAWFTLNIGRYIGLKGMDWLLSQAENVKENWVGTFSNLGTWNLPSEPIVFVVPIAPTTPLSVGCVTVNGRMALSLHVHPALGVSTAELENWLDQWVKVL